MGKGNWFRKVLPIDPGLYPGVLDLDGERHRLHLRIEASGGGLLTIDASRILHLNPTAAEIVFHLIDGLTAEETVKQMKRRYRIGREALLGDVERILNAVRSLSATDRVCPSSDLGVELIEPYSPELSAPLRMDLALTYRCQNRCVHCYNEEAGTVEELDTEGWRGVLDACLKAGIPHVVFTGGEPTLRDDLVDLVTYAEELGLVTGLNTNGRRLATEGYAGKLFEAGLDHVQITLESADSAIHNAMTGTDAYEETIAGLRASVKAGLYTMTNTTMTKTNVSGLENLVDFVAEEGLSVFAVNGMIYSGRGETSTIELTPQETIPVLEELGKRAREKNLRFIWYTPTRYCELNPIEMGLGVKQCTAARLSMAIEPDGSVIPCQSYYESVGHILKDGWTDIWNHPLCRKLRIPQKPLAECEACEHLTLCGGGCPLETEHRGVCCREIASG